MPVGRALRRGAATGGTGSTASTQRYVAWNTAEAASGYLAAYRMDGDGTTVGPRYTSTGSSSVYGVTWARGAAYIAYLTANGYLRTRPFIGAGFGGESMAALPGTATPPRGMALGISPDNTKIVAFNGTGTGQIYGVDPATGVPTGVVSSTFGYTETNAFVSAASWSPLGDYFVVCQTSPTVTLWAPAANGLSATTVPIGNNQGGNAGAAWLPDGSGFFTVGANYVYGVGRYAGNTFSAYGGVVGYGSSTYTMSGVAISPDGKLLAASCGPEIWVMATNGAATPTTPVATLNAGGTVNGIGWAPDGQRLYALYVSGTTMNLPSWARTGTTTMSTTITATPINTGFGFASNNVNALAIAS